MCVGDSSRNEFSPPVLFPDLNSSRAFLPIPVIFMKRIITWPVGHIVSVFLTGHSMCLVDIRRDYLQSRKVETADQYPVILEKV